MTDRKGAIFAIGYAREHLQKCETIMADSGYTGNNFAAMMKKLIGARVEIIKRNELHKFVVLPKRWIVERTFAWLDDYRILWKNCERNLHNSLQAVKVAFISLLLRS
jgi:transposase